MSLLLVFHYVDVMFDSYMANKANDLSIDRCNLLYVSWVREIVHELAQLSWDFPLLEETTSFYVSHV